MSENLINVFCAIMFIVTIFGGLAYIGYVSDEQDHRHKIELEKAKQGIFDQPTIKECFFKKYSRQIIFTLFLVILIIGICYIFKVPSDLPKYILDIIR